MIAQSNPKTMRTISRQRSPPLSIVKSHCYSHTITITQTLTDTHHFNTMF